MSNKSPTTILLFSFVFFLHKMNKLSVIFFLCLLSLNVVAQKQANNWFFGHKAGLNFNKGNPIATNESEMNASRSPAVISDSMTGALLFYSDGNKVWDRTHQVMPHGDNLNGGSWMAFQSNLIVPYPSNPHLYYLFTLAYTVGSSGAELYYHIIDLRLNGGKGDVIVSEKNKFLLGNIAGKITAIPHANQKDYWLIVHEMGSDGFQVAKVSEDGISSFNTQSIGEKYLCADTGISPPQGFWGYLKASPDGTMLATTIKAPFDEPINLFDFNAETGKISNYRPIKKGYGEPFGLSFSPDNSKLYVSFETPYTDRENVEKLVDAVYQYDVSSGDGTKINATALGLIPDNPTTNIKSENYTGGPVLFSLQLAPDGRIYGGENWLSPYGSVNSLLVIDKPNKSGFECSINIKRFNFGNGLGGSYLPNFIESYFNGIESVSVCSDPKSVTIYPNPTAQKVKVDIPQGCDRNLKLEIYNTLGQKVTPDLGLLSVSEVDLSNLSSGVFLFVLTNSYNSKVIKKVIKL